MTSEGVSITETLETLATLRVVGRSRHETYLHTLATHTPPSVDERSRDGRDGLPSYHRHVVRRLDLRNDGRLHRAEWVDSETKAPHLFATRKPYRNIVVMVDNDVLVSADGSTEFSKATLLADLLDHECVRIYRYADNGPPAGTAAVDDHPDVYQGWAVVTDRDPDNKSWGVVHESGPGAYSLSGVMGNGGDVAAADVRSGAYGDCSPSEAADRRRADWLAAQVAAQALGADLYISERPYLQRATWDVGRGATICTIADALPVLGLYLRAQGEFVVADRVRFNRGLFFWVGTRELLPAAWRWFSACVKHGSGTSDDSMVILGGSLLQRTERALEARDGVHVALNQPQNNDTQDAALSHLDTTLLFLMAAVDVAARVAHRVLGLPPTSEYRAAWQNQQPGGWLDQVRAVEPGLAAVVDAGTPGDHVLTILRLLRNSVHGAALQGLAFVNGSSPMQSLVGLPSNDEAELLAAMDATGGRARWGVKQTPPDRVHLDPGEFVDELFEQAVVLLNDLMAATPVERLSHVSLAPSDLAPPADTGRGKFGGPFDNAFRLSIRWLLGF